MVPRMQLEHLILLGRVRIKKTAIWRFFVWDTKGDTCHTRYVTKSAQGGKNYIKEYINQIAVTATIFYFYIQDNKK